MEYRFQIKNGNISEGSNTIFIKEFIAEVEAADLTPGLELLIKAHGGKLVEEEARPKRKSTKKAVSDGGS